MNYNLQMKIREYLRFIWKEEFTQNADMEEQIINKLSKTLKEELFLEANGKILNKYPMFFANFSESFLRQLMYKMKEVRHTPEDLIFSVKPTIYLITLILEQFRKERMMTMKFFSS